MRIQLIANPAAGRAAQTRIRAAEAFFRERGCDVALALTNARGDARRLAAAARDGGYDRIVALGGDGTLNEVLNGLAPSTIPVAFLPSGTVNVLALELGIPFGLEAGCRVALDGWPQTVSLGQAGPDKFLLMAGIGFDAAVVRGVSNRLKRRIGRLAYVVAGLGALAGWRAPRLQVSCADGSRAECGSVIVGNGRLYGGRFSLTPHACLGDPDFEVLLLQPGLWPLLATTLRAVTGRPPAPAHGRLLRTTSLAVSGCAPVQLDGDDCGDLPMNFSILPRAAVLMTPPHP